jgi:tRNA nucleotidyltransferase/poly(A) polymerase
LRALRFVNTFNQQQHLSFDFDSATRRSIKKHYFLIQWLAKERIREEVMKVFSKDDPFGYVSLLDETNMLKFVFPCVAATK